MASGSFADCVRLWDLNPSNREKDGEILKPVASIPIVGIPIISFLINNDEDDNHNHNHNHFTCRMVL